MDNPLNFFSRSARKAQTGTTYAATGINDPELEQPELDREDGSSRPTTIRDVVPELASPSQRANTYAKMMNHSSVDVSMRVTKTPVLGADFYVDPYDSLPINVEIGQFIHDNLFGGMSAPFSMSLADILHFFEDGYSIPEKVFELREWTPPGQGRNTRQYTMLKKLGIRPPTTIKEIVYDDNGGPVEVVQNAIRGDNKAQEVTLPISKVMIFTFARNGGDLQGKSLLRTAYQHWYYAQHFYKIDAIQKERHGIGVPYGKLLPGFTEETKKVLRRMLRNIRTNEESFIIELPNVEIGFKELSGQPVDVLSSAVHHNAMILMNVLAQFLVQGIEGSSGSRATGGVQSDIFMKALRYVANYICEMVNMYLIPELVVWNYPTRSFPQLKVRNIGETRDLQMLGSALSGLFTSGGLSKTPETENWVRGVFDMPGIDEAGFMAALERLAAQSATTTVPSSETGAGDSTSNGNGSNPRGSQKPGGTGNVGKPTNAAD